MAEPAPASDPGIALALGSAFLGMYAHAGFLCGLNEAGIFPKHISGSSAGAIAGGFYAAGFRGEALKAAILSKAFKTSFADPGMIARWLPMVLGAKLSGVLSGRRVVSYLQKKLPVRRIEELPDVRLSISVTDLKNREGFFLTRGPLAESIMASCAVPLLFTGQSVEGREFHDGGVLHEAPLDAFIESPEIHTIILHNLKASPARENSLKLPSVFSRSHHILSQALLEFRRKEAERRGKRVILIETAHPSPGLFQSQATKNRYFDLGVDASRSVKQALSP